MKKVKEKNDGRELFIHKKKKKTIVTFRENIGLMPNRCYYIFLFTVFENDYLLVLIISAVRFNYVYLYTSYTEQCVVHDRHVKK